MLNSIMAKGLLVPLAHTIWNGQKEMVLSHYLEWTKRSGVEGNG
jgi:hypothetical protein